MFEIKNVTKKYGNEFALQGISMTIKKGLNFIVGPSGSGKTTLLKIISGMEQDFDGEVSCGGKEIKALSSTDKSNFYNNIFGFVWQDFNLLEDRTVWDNIMLPSYLKDSKQQENALKIVKDLKLQAITKQKVKNLSGGQKQRVAIARELMKNPTIIIADEPTSALDGKTAKGAMELLRAISKRRTVIIVTHDTSLIQDRDTVFTLDKGELIQSTNNEVTPVVPLELPVFKKLSLRGAFLLAKNSVVNKWGRSLVSVVSLMIAGILLLTTCSGAVGKSSDDQFQNLLNTYGKTLLDMHVIDSFMSAAGTDNKGNEEPKADVNQNISGLYEKYVHDERVDFALFLQPFNDIKITMDGKEHTIENTGSSPEIKDMIAGKMPVSGNEVVVPESFLKKVGKDKDAILGTEIEFEGTIFNWVNDQPIPKNTEITVKIVGVADTFISTEIEGNKIEYTLDDAFFFSKDALDNLRKQAGLDDTGLDFTMRAKSMENLVSLKNELNKQGIVPLGQFELVADFVSLDGQSTQQSGFASTMIGLLALVMLALIFFVTGVMRKKEYAIYKASGYHNSHLWMLSFVEIGMYATSGIVFMLVSSPLLSMVTSKLFGISIMNKEMLLMSAVFIIISAILAYVTNALTFVKISIASALKDGTRS